MKKRAGKKKSFHLGKIQINFTNRLTYTILSVMILVLAGVAVWAAVPGVSHTADEINYGFGQEIMGKSNGDFHINAKDGTVSRVVINYDSGGGGATGGLSIRDGTTTEIVKLDGLSNYIMGNVGIGDTNPGAKLDVEGDVFIRDKLSLADASIHGAGNYFGDLNEIWDLGYELNVVGSPNAGYFIGDVEITGDVLIGGDVDFTFFVDTTDDEVGIGTNNPIEKLDVRGKGRFNGLESWGQPFTASSGYNYFPYISSGTYEDLRINPTDGRIYYTTSSAKYKDNIIGLDEDYYNILKVRPVSFTYKDSGEKSIGYIAEEFDELGLNKLVSYDANNAPFSIHYEYIPIYLKEIVKDHEEKINEQQQQIEDLQQRIYELEN